jgi:hypothetical protein
MTSPKEYLTASVLLWMLEEDRSACEKHWGKPCPFCKRGVLHRGHWQSKGELPKEFLAPAGFLLRFSLCCSNRKCRRRFSPPSLRFPPGGKYSTAVILLVKLMHLPKSETRARKLAELFCVSLSTVRRWIFRWRAFCATKTKWSQEQGAIFQLGGGGFDDVLSAIRKINANPDMMFLALVKQCHSLWHEWRCRLINIPQSLGPKSTSPPEG